MKNYKQAFYLWPLLLLLPAGCVTKSGSIGKPDLVVSFIESTRTGGRLIVRVKVTNAGLAACSSFNNYIEISRTNRPERIQTQISPGLKPGQSRILTYSFSEALIPSSSPTLTAIVDSKVARVDELNETNNEKTVAIP